MEERIHQHFPRKNHQTAKQRTPKLFLKKSSNFSKEGDAAIRKFPPPSPLFKVLEWALWSGLGCLLRISPGEGENKTICYGAQIRYLNGESNAAVHFCTTVFPTKKEKNEESCIYFSSNISQHFFHFLTLRSHWPRS